MVRQLLSTLNNKALGSSLKRWVRPVSWARSVQIGRVDFLAAKPQLQDLNILRAVEYFSGQQALNQNPQSAECTPGHGCNRQEQSREQKYFDHDDYQRRVGG